MDESLALSKTSTTVINDVNLLLEKLLLKELPLKKNNVEISFHQPTHDWSSRLNGPTLNLFLHDIRKNKLRQAQWETRPNGRERAIQQRAPLRFDLRYLLTAWVNDGDPEEEHYLLTAALLAMARHPRLPDSEPNGKEILPEDSRIDFEFLPAGLRNQPAPISLSIAEPDELLNPADIWSALNTELRPAITCTVTISLDPFQPIDLAVVRQRRLRFGPLADAATKPGSADRLIDEWPRPTGRDLPQRDIYELEGTVGGDEPLETIRVFMVGRGVNGGDLEIPVVANAELTECKFLVEQLTVGTYQLAVSAADHRPVRFEVVILPQETDDRRQQKEKIWLLTSIKKQGE